MAPEADDDGKVPGGERGEREAQQQDPHAAPPAGEDGERVITEPQLRRFHAIARGAPAWSDEQIHELLTAYGYNSSKEIRARDYEAIVAHVTGSFDEWKAKPKNAAA